MAAEAARRPARRVLSVVPGLASLLSYNPRWLPKDLVAGLVLTALLVPQGMAYAELAGLPAITCLYTSILCLVGYARFGPSRILVLAVGLPGLQNPVRGDDQRVSAIIGMTRKHRIQQT